MRFPCTTCRHSPSTASTSASPSPQGACTAGGCGGARGESRRPRTAARRTGAGGKAAGRWGPAAAARAEKQATYCPGVRLFAGGIAIQSGRCYVLFVLRDRRGLFLAFAQPGLRIPPGQLVRLNTPAGAKVKGRIFYLVPIRAIGLVVPVDHIVLTAIRVQEVGSRVVIILSPGGTRVTVDFERRP